MDILEGAYFCVSDLPGTRNKPKGEINNTPISYYVDAMIKNNTHVLHLFCMIESETKLWNSHWNNQPVKEKNQKSVRPWKHFKRPETYYFPTYVQTFTRSVCIASYNVHK